MGQTISIAAYSQSERKEAACFSLIRRAEEILRREVSENRIFPLAMPGVTLTE